MVKDWYWRINSGLILPPNDCIHFQISTFQPEIGIFPMQWLRAKCQLWREWNRMNEWEEKQNTWNMHDWESENGGKMVCSSFVLTLYYLLRDCVASVHQRWYHLCFPIHVSLVRMHAYVHQAHVFAFPMPEITRISGNRYRMLNGKLQFGKKWNKSGVVFPPNECNLRVLSVVLKTGTHKMLHFGCTWS